MLFILNALKVKDDAFADDRQPIVYGWESIDAIELQKMYLCGTHHLCVVSGDIINVPTDRPIVIT